MGILFSLKDKPYGRGQVSFDLRHQSRSHLSPKEARLQSAERLCAPASLQRVAWVCTWHVRTSSACPAARAGGGLTPKETAVPLRPCSGGASLQPVPFVCFLKKEKTRK